MRSPVTSRKGVCILIAALAVLALARAAANAQTESAQPGAVREREVLIELESFGVGQVVRPGCFSGVRVRLTDSAARPREVAVRLSSRDGDGDTIESERFVTLNPGQRMGVWLQWGTPWRLRAGSFYTVTVHEALAGGASEFLIGRQVGAKRIAPKLVSPPTSDLIGVVGPGSLMGLDQFETIQLPNSSRRARHEISQIVGGLIPAAMPDHWEGLEAFSAIVWADEDPSELSLGQQEALIEWINRGGHLVIPIRGVSSPWLTPGRSGLGSILPAGAWQRHPGRSLRPYANLITDEDGLGVLGSIPESVVIHEFVADDGADLRNGACIVSGIDGCIVARRLVGLGMVTVIGIDLRHVQTSRILQADRFWNRILGRRGDVVNGATRPTGALGSIGGWGGAQYVDDNVFGQISKSRAAGVGVILGLVVFASYWLVAGPVGFGILRSRVWTHHAWVGFVCVALVFTLLSWISVNAARPNEVEIRHYTLLQHVYGQPVQRARVFAGILLPEYGEQLVAADLVDADQRWNQAIWPLSDPDSDPGLSFPDARSYQINARNLGHVRVPARSTMKQFQIEWLGGPRLNMPIPARPELAPRLTSNPPVSGVLVHDLPAALEDVHVIVIEGQTLEQQEMQDDQPKPRKGRLRARGHVSALRDAWAPDVELDLATVFSGDSAEPVERLLRKVVPRSSFGGSVSQPALRDRDRLVLVSLFPQIQPPDYYENPDDRPNQELTEMRRRFTHRFDLGQWFTQPCVIVLGRLRGVPSPVPIAVDGREIQADPSHNDGEVLIQWVYPLPPRPVHFSNPPKAEAAR